ncbi:MAG: 30S ribosomal protein S8 [Candidatus Andersenbacteria bacterium]|nr:30S ribosomal protein S8 [bacterium]MDZ4225627.1 30S ribosomal protein S8 [Candidatus Andersenbacteria bacterium]
MDTIANMLTSLINAQRAGKQRVAVPYSGIKERLAQILQEKGFLSALRVQSGPKAKLVLTLAYDEKGQARIHGLKRISRPGQRWYVKKSRIPYSMDGMGCIVLSTPQGLMDDHKARKAGLGGEMICEIW